jgi:hypothetical protein
MWTMEHLIRRVIVLTLFLCVLGRAASTGSRVEEEQTGDVAMLQTQSTIAGENRE